MRGDIVNNKQQSDDATGWILALFFCWGGFFQFVVGTFYIIFFFLGMLTPVHLQRVGNTGQVISVLMAANGIMEWLASRWISGNLSNRDNT